MAIVDDEEFVFNAALDRPAGEARNAFLDDACAGNVTFRGRIEQLLAAFGDGHFLNSAVSPKHLASSSFIREEPGTVIGAYRLLEQIGEGGMGLVFLAEQSQPLKRHVALKIIKPGMDTRTVVARFDAERQALAVMDHPHIARVYDAGATDSGRPYFVMELVRGVPITEYCEQHELDLENRLKLFIEVCGAVQHAHQKGIIHRDLKPTNILVAHDDTGPVSKVIDFGVAKATSRQLTECTLFTHFAQVIGTPLYMSPEQAELNYEDVDTRTDVYSLGVVMYELLAGTTPFDAELLRSAGFDEMRRIIREEDPPKPSTRATTMVAATTAAIKLRNGSRVAAIALKGDLDWIVMKALEKDRQRRYESAGALAADVRRYLENLPVEAAAPSTIYRLRKFARRNQSRIVVSSVLVALLGSAIATAAVITMEERRALENLSHQIKESLVSARTAIESKNLGLAEACLAEATALGRQAPNRFANLASEIKTARDEVAKTRADRERFTRFMELSQRARDDMSSHAEAGDRAAKESLNFYGVLSDANWQRDLEGSTLNAQEQEQIRQEAYWTLICLADFYIRWDGDRTKARRSIELLGKAERIRKPTRAFFWIRARANKWEGKEDAQKEDLSRIETAPTISAWDYFLEGHTAGWRGHVDVMMAAYRQALRLEPDHFNSLFFLALGSEDLHTRIAYFTACIALRPNHWASYAERGSAELNLEHWDEAAKDFSAALAFRPTHEKQAYWRLMRGAAFYEMGRIDEGRHDALLGIELVKKKIENRERVLLRPLTRSAEHIQDDQIELELWRLILLAAKKDATTDSLFLAKTHASLGDALYAREKFSEAKKILYEGIAIDNNELNDHWVRFKLQSCLGAVMAAQGCEDAAEPLLVAGYQGMRDRQAQMETVREKHWVGRARQLLVAFYEKSGRTEAARHWRDEADVVPLPNQ